VIDAVIRTGGKQYRVHEGSVLNVATMDAEPGSRVELHDVLLVSNDGSVTVGTPTVDGAIVVAEVVEHGRGKKVINFKYKAKVRYRRKRGHRQGYTTLSIKEITANGVTVTAPERARRPEPEPEAPAMDMSARPAGFAGRVEAEEPVAAAPAQEPVAEASETPATEETPAPRTRRRARSAESTESTEENKDE
jgi:large subunit ribosomal protein L21